MDRYLETEMQSFTTHIDTSQFQDIELKETLTQMKDKRENWWEGIGPGGSISCRVLESGGTVLFGACDRIFYALSTEGEELWRFKTNGVVLEGCAASEELVFFGSADGNIYALEKVSGKELWRFKTKDKIVDNPIFHEGRVYMGGCLDQNFYCLEAETGKEIWRFHTKEGTVSVPLIIDDRIYCGYSDRNFYCLDMNGKVLWSYPISNTVAAWPAVHYKNHLYFGSWDCNLYCINMNGKLKWKFPVPHPAMRPHEWEGRIYFSCWDNNVYCLDAETGKLVWKFNCNGFPGGSFSVNNGTVFTGSTDNNIYAIDALTGKLKWRYPTNGMIVQVTTFNGRVYAGSWDCNLYCLSYGGKLLWKFHTSMSSPSKVIPPESNLSKTIEFTIQSEPTQEDKEHYQLHTLEPEESKSTYIKKSEYITKNIYKAKKFHTISDTEL